MDKNTLEQLLSTYNWWSGVSTIAVAVGILGEYVAHFIFEKEARENRLEMGVSILFGVLVLGGVVGEYQFGKRITQLAEQLQQIADTEVAAARRDAELARKQSADTNERAARTEREAARLEKEAAQDLRVTNVARQKAEEARQKAEGFSAQIAQANERAAKAEEDAAKSNATAEQEKVARLQLMAQLADRMLTEDQKRRLRIAVARLKGKTVDFALVGDTWDVSNFSGMIMQCMIDEGVLLNRVHPLSGGGARGVLVGIKDDADAPFKDTATDFIRILQESVGRGVGPWKYDDLDPNKMGAMTTGQDKGALPLGQSPLRIVVASK